MDWHAFRKRFPLPEDEIFLNTGTLGCAANSVIDKLCQSQRKLAATIANWEYLNDDREWITGYTPEKNLRNRLGRLFGANPSEISLTQNATMGINFIAHGLDWQQGDEIIQTNQEHPGARCPWEVLTERNGIVVRQVHLPIPLNDPAEILNRIESAFTERTKLLAVPHITSGLGTVFPVKELCALARAKGVISLIDGAQVPGHVMLNISDIGADAYSASLHKWLFAPAGNGFLYVQKELVNRIWHTQSSEAWKDPDTGFRLQQRGTGNPSLLHALDAALDIFEETGPQNWCLRVKTLGDILRRGIQEMPELRVKLRFNTSTHPELCAGITTIEFADIPSPKVVRHLWDNCKIRVRDVGEPYGLRISTAAYTQEYEVDKLVTKLGELC
ncbi:MAG: aminotransferase class V-fold PLP-dependent enzyme [Holophagales bacterium]|jgi:selenocysteine lyase/cysteine desulfurase|nr:aminotransferase class V-fold PLP-dependent enzyme [Holophagales bacterium]